MSDNGMAAIDDLLASRDRFDAFVYTPWQEALAEVKLRADNQALDAYLTAGMGVPPELSAQPSMVLCRHLATINYEMHRFMQCADVFTELKPIVLEYTADLFVDVNNLKYALGKLAFYKGRSKNGDSIFQHKSIINMNESNGIPISEVTTKWGQSLVAFHHEWLDFTLQNRQPTKLDISDFYLSSGGQACLYYKNLMSLFLKNTILFENFELNKRETPFLRTILLPTLMAIQEETGYKPLVVNLGPTGNEHDRFWLAYPASQEAFVDKKFAQ